MKLHYTFQPDHYQNHVACQHRNVPQPNAGYYDPEQFSPASQYYPEHDNKPINNDPHYRQHARLHVPNHSGSGFYTVNDQNSFNLLSSKQQIYGLQSNYTNVKRITHYHGQQTPHFYQPQMQNTCYQNNDRFGIQGATVNNNNHGVVHQQFLYPQMHNSHNANQHSSSNQYPGKPYQDQPDCYSAHRNYTPTRSG